MKKNAVAYGKVYEGNSPKLISFNLYTLYQANSILEGDATTNDFVKFTEVIPEKSGDKVAKAWLTEQKTSNGAISRLNLLLHTVVLIQVVALRLLMHHSEMLV